MSPNLSYPRFNRILTALTLAGLLVVGLWLRLRFAQTVQLYPDEFVTLLAARMIGAKGAPALPSGLFYDHGLLFSYLAGLAGLLGQPDMAARYVSLVLGLLTLGMTFFVGQRWFSPAVGLIATAGLAIAPTAIEWSGRARMYALLQFLVLLTIWLAYEGIVYNKTRWRWAAMLAYLGATLTQFVAVTLTPPLLAAGVITWLTAQYYLTQRPKGAKPQGNIKKFWLWDGLSLKISWRLWLELAVFVAILVIAFLVKRLGQPKGIETFEATQTLTGLAQVVTIYGGFSLNLTEGWRAIAPFYLTLPALIFTPLALVAVVVSLITLFFPKTQKSASVSAPEPTGALTLLPCYAATLSSLFLALILLATTLEMLIFVSPDRRDDKYLFMLLPALLLLGAWGMCQIGSSVRCQVAGSKVASLALLFPLPSLLSPLLASSLIIAMAWPGAQRLFSNLGEDYEAAFAYVKKHWQPGDTILTGTPAAAAFYLNRNDFYGVQRRGGYDYRLLTIGGQAVDRWLGSPAIRTETELHQILAQQRVWLVLERWGLQSEYYDLPFQQQLLAQTNFETETQGIFILRSKPDPRPLALDPVYPLQADFGSQARLTGYTVEPDMLAPGQVVRLTLYWQALAKMPHDYTVFVHLRQPNGGNVTQADHRPLGQLYPTTLWPVGETIRESSDLTLPADLPPGDYELWAGLYLLDTGERLPVQNDASGENAVKLGVIHGKR